MRVICFDDDDDDDDDDDEDDEDSYWMCICDSSKKYKE